MLFEGSLKNNFIGSDKIKTCERAKVGDIKQKIGMTGQPVFTTTSSLTSDIFEYVKGGIHA